MVKKLFLVFAFVFTNTLLKAGADQDTNYVQKFKNIFAAKIFLMNNGFTYTLTPRNNPHFSAQQLGDAKVIYNPYIPPTTGVSVNIKGVGFTYVFKFTDDYLDTTGRAKSAFKQFQMNIYGTKLGFEAYYQDYKRFYFHYKGDQILLKNYNSDIRAYQWGANGIFLFNGKKFSYNAAFNQTVLQKKSAGSWMMILALKFNEIKSHDLIPDSVKGYYTYFATNLLRNRNYAFLLQTGYGFNLTKKNFYFSGAVLAGLGVQQQSYSFTYDKSYKVGFPLVARGKASMGYNGKIFFTGLFANADVAQSSIKSLKTQQTVYSYGVYLGLRAVKFSKTKGQLKQEAKRKKLAEKTASKKAKEAAKKTKEAKQKPKKK